MRFLEHPGSTAWCLAAELDSTLNMVEEQIAGLWAELATIKEDHQRIVAERTGIVAAHTRIGLELHAIKLEWARSQARGTVATWLDLARKQILRHYGQLTPTACRGLERLDGFGPALSSLG